MRQLGFWGGSGPEHRQNGKTATGCSPAAGTQRPAGDSVTYQAPALMQTSETASALRGPTAHGLALLF